MKYNKILEKKYILEYTIRIFLNVIGSSNFFKYLRELMFGENKYIYKVNLISL